MSPGEAQVLMEQVALAPHQWSEWATPVVVYWVVCAAIQTMPEPLPMERWYNWAYNFLQVVAANLSKVGTKRV